MLLSCLCAYSISHVGIYCKGRSFYNEAFFLKRKFEGLIHGSPCAPLPLWGGLAVDRGSISKQQHRRNKSGSIAINPRHNAQINAINAVYNVYIFREFVRIISAFIVSVIGGMVVDNGNVSVGVRCSWG